MYKDKDKQREADRERQRRYRANRGLKAYPKGVTNTGRDGQGVTELVNAEPNTGDKRLKDYYDEHRETTNPKRGKDIKVFEDLLPDVQQTIRTISESNEEFKRRTSIAIAYQHTFPERYYE